MNRRVVAFVSAIVVASFVTACGGTKTTPTAPTPTSTPTRIIGLSGNLAFGNVQVGMTADAVVRISNSGTATLTVSGMTGPSGYSASWTSGTVDAGGSRDVTIRFAPTAAQSYNGTLTVNADHTSGTNTMSVAGTGVLPPRVSTVTVTAPDLIYMGETATATATVTKTDGSSGAAVGCSWGGDTLTVATINASGQISALTPGRVTIWCDVEGVRGTKLIRVVPNYQGNWLGSYAVESCQQSGDFASINFCSNYPRDRVFPLSASFTQSRDTVTGQFNLGQIQGQQQSGPVAIDGTLTLAITHLATGTSTIISNWTVNQSRAGQITGSMLLTWRDVVASGELRVQSRVFNTNKQSLMPLLGPTRAHGTSLAELLEAVRR